MCVCHAFLHSSVLGHLGHAHIVSCLPDSTVVGRGKGNWCDGSQSLQSRTEQTTFSPLCSQIAVLRESWAWSLCAPRGLRVAWARCSQDGRRETVLGGAAGSQAVSASSETGKKQLSSHRSMWRPCGLAPLLTLRLLGDAVGLMEFSSPGSS